MKYAALTADYNILRPDTFHILLKEVLAGSEFISKIRFSQNKEIEVPSRVDGKRRNLARVSDFVSWDEACRVPRHKITHECKIPPLSIHE